MVADGRVIHAYGRSDLWRITYPQTSCYNSILGRRRSSGPGVEERVALEDFAATLGIISSVVVLDDLAVAEIDVLCRASGRH